LENPVDFVGIPVEWMHYPNSVKMASSNDGVGKGWKRCIFPFTVHSSSARIVYFPKAISGCERRIMYSNHNVCQLSAFQPSRSDTEETSVMTVHGNWEWTAVVEILCSGSGKMGMSTGTKRGMRLKPGKTGKREWNR